MVLLRHLNNCDLLTLTWSFTCIVLIFARFLVSHIIILCIQRSAIHVFKQTVAYLWFLRFLVFAYALKLTSLSLKTIIFTKSLINEHTPFQFSLFRSVFKGSVHKICVCVKKKDYFRWLSEISFKAFIKPHVKHNGNAQNKNFSSKWDRSIHKLCTC